MNADDLGISERVNESTFELLADKRITSSTLLANGPAIEQAVRKVGEFSDCSFGGHLNVIEFEPLSERAASVLTADGGMSRPLVERSAHNPKFMKAVYEEFCAQILKLQACGVPVSHLDSHQHVHTFPWLFPVVKAVQMRFKIRAIRSSRNIYAPEERISGKLQAQKTAFNWALRHVYQSCTTDGMTDLQALMLMTAEQVRPFKWIEIMVHPGAGADLDGMTLRTDWIKRLSFPARLANYRDLLNRKYG